MARTIKQGIRFTSGNTYLTYRCGCGLQIEIPIEDLVPDKAVDYHGCGVSVVTFPAGEVASYRQTVGLPKLGE